MSRENEVKELLQENETQNVVEEEEEQQQTFETQIDNDNDCMEEVHVEQ